jgi:hypothetical protein
MGSGTPAGRRRSRFPGAGSWDQWATGLVPGGHRGGVTAGGGACCPGGTGTRLLYAAQGARRAVAVRPGRRQQGCDQRRLACPGGAGQAEVRTGTGRCAAAVMRVRAVPPAGPRAPRWTGQSRNRTHGRWLRFARVIPSLPARHRLAGHPRPVQVVRPAGRSTCTGRERPAPRKGGRRRRDDPPRTGVRVRAREKTTVITARTGKNNS